MNPEENSSYSSAIINFSYHHHLYGKTYVEIPANFAFNPLNGKLNPICHLVALLGAHHILHVSRIRVKKQTGHKLLFLRKNASGKNVAYGNPVFQGAGRSTCGTLQ